MHFSIRVLAPFALAFASSSATAQNPVVKSVQELPLCRSRTGIEFIAPVTSEEVPVFHGPSPNPESFLIVLEMAFEQDGPPLAGVLEGAFVPAPGAVVVPPTDVDGNGLQGDPHPAIPALSLVADDDLFFNGMPVPAGTNLASFVECVGSEIEHGGGQTTTVTWLLDPLRYFLVDLNGDMGTNLVATIHGQKAKTFFRHGWDVKYTGVLSSQDPTISIWTEDWISTVDRDPAIGDPTPFLVCVEVRIPCTWDSSTFPPTPVPLEPIFGPCWAGAMACTENFPPMPGPGFHPMFPGFDVRLSDDYFDLATGTFVPGGVITGGACGVIWGSTGASLAYAFRQSSVHAWYGVNGVIDTTPLGGGDDQLVYRFTQRVRARRGRGARAGRRVRGGVRPRDRRGRPRRRRAQRRSPRRRAARQGGSRRCAAASPRCAETTPPRSRTSPALSTESSAGACGWTPRRS